MRRVQCIGVLLFVLQLTSGATPMCRLKSLGSEVGQAVNSIRQLGVRLVSLDKTVGCGMYSISLFYVGTSHLLMRVLYWLPASELFGRPAA